MDDDRIGSLFGIFGARERPALNTVLRIPGGRLIRGFIVNMAAMPLPGSPTSQPVESSKFIWQVADALRPILCSIAAQATPFD
jgi:hypothetical protein